MEKAQAVFPEAEIEINGEVVAVKCSYRTIYNFEKATGKPIAFLLSNGNIASLAVVAEFLSAALIGKNRKFSVNYLLEHMTPKIVHEAIALIPKVVEAAFVDQDKQDHEKKD